MALGIRLKRTFESEGGLIVGKRYTMKRGFATSYWYVAEYDESNNRAVLIFDQWDVSSADYGKSTYGQIGSYWPGRIIYGSDYHQDISGQNISEPYVESFMPFYNICLDGIEYQNAPYGTGLYLIPLSMINLDIDHITELGSGPYWDALQKVSSTSRGAWLGDIYAKGSSNWRAPIVHREGNPVLQLTDVAELACPCFNLDTSNFTVDGNQLVYIPEEKYGFKLGASYTFGNNGSKDITWDCVEIKDGYVVLLTTNDAEDPNGGGWPGYKMTGPTGSTGNPWGNANTNYNGNISGANISSYDTYVSTFIQNYNPGGELVLQKRIEANGTEKVLLERVYDECGRIVFERQNAYKVEYIYDENGNLIKESINGPLSSGTGISVVSREYEYTQITIPRSVAEENATYYNPASGAYDRKKY